MSALAVAGAANPAGEAKRRPVVALAGENPLAVAGRGFARYERVTLRAAVNGTQRVKRLRATATGRFTATFVGANAACQPLSVSAVGAAGSRAMLRRVAIPPACGPPIQP